MAIKRASRRDEMAEGSSSKVVDHDSEQDSDAPEEESNESRRKSIKGLDKSRRPVKKSKNTESRSKAESNSEAPVEELADNEMVFTSSSPASSSTGHLLDPSLFAASFSKRKVTPNKESSSGPHLKSSASREIKKRFGIVKGRDGQPMRRLKDGQTTVRVLQKDSSRNDRNKSTKEEILPPPMPIESTQVLPNAKIRAFRKQKLGLRERTKEKKDEGVVRSLKTKDDPLGLQDPAFMKGGEFEGIGLTAKRRRPSKRSTPSTQESGGRVKCEYM